MYKNYRSSVILLGVFFFSFVAFFQIGYAESDDDATDRIEGVLRQSKGREIVDWGNGTFTVTLRTHTVADKPNVVFEMKDLSGNAIPAQKNQKESYNCKNNFCTYVITADFPGYDPSAPGFGYSSYIIRSAKSGKIFVEEKIPEFVATLNTQSENATELDADRTVFLNLKNNSGKTLIITSVESGNDKLKILDRVPQSGDELGNNGVYGIRIELPQVVNINEDSFLVNVKYKVDGVDSEISSTIYVKLGFREDDSIFSNDNDDQANIEEERVVEAEIEAKSEEAFGAKAEAEIKTKPEEVLGTKTKTETEAKTNIDDNKVTRHTKVWYVVTKVGDTLWDHRVAIGDTAVVVGALGLSVYGAYKLIHRNTTISDGDSPSGGDDKKKGKRWLLWQYWKVGKTKQPERKTEEQGQELTTIDHTQADNAADAAPQPEQTPVAPSQITVVPPATVPTTTNETNAGAAEEVTTRQGSGIVGQVTQRLTNVGRSIRGVTQGVVNRGRNVLEALRLVRRVGVGAAATTTVVTVPAPQQTLEPAQLHPATQVQPTQADNTAGVVPQLEQTLATPSQITDVVIDGAAALAPQQPVQIVPLETETVNEEHVPAIVTTTLVAQPVTEVAQPSPSAVTIREAPTPEQQLPLTTQEPSIAPPPPPPPPPPPQTDQPAPGADGDGLPTSVLVEPMGALSINEGGSSSNS